MIFMPPRAGKLIADDVLILTTNGWKKHGNLKVNDYVFGINGKPIKILAVSKKGIADIEIEFMNGEKIQCHQNHEWKLFDRSYGKWRTVETKELIKITKFKKQKKVIVSDGNKKRCLYQLPDYSAIEFEQKELKVDPYVLGAWLGDGTKGKPCITHDVNDYQVIDEVKKNYPISKVWVHKITGVLTTNFAGDGHFGKACSFRKDLKKIGVLNNKYIPKIYKFSSIKQRLELLAGLIDTDGSVDKMSRVQISTVSKKLANDISDIIFSLGWYAYIIKTKPKLSTSGIQGRKIVYNIGFNPKVEIPTKLPRKKIKRFPVNRRIGIKSVKKIKGKIGQCIQVDSPDGLYLVGKKFIPTHNSQLATINFPAWYLGRNPDKEIITVSYSGELALDFGSKTRDLMQDEIYREIFDVQLREDEKAKGKWKTKQGGYYISVGVGGALTGRGTDCLIIDDPIKNREEAESEVYRNRVWDFYTSTAYTRLNPNGAVIIILTRWHLDDLAGRLLKHEKENWEVIEFPAIALQDEKYRKKGEPLWASRYSLEEYEKTKKTIGIMNWNALYQQNPILSESQEFKPHWFKKRKQEDIDILSTRNFLTIDTAISQRTSADYTGIVKNYVDKENKWNIKSSHLRINPKELIDLLFNLYEQDNYEKMGIEKTIYLQAIKPFLDDEMRKRNKFLPIVELLHNQIQKETRIRGLIPRYESGSIIHIENENQELENELLSFPVGVNDDIIDALQYQSQIAEAPEMEIEETLQVLQNRRNRMDTYKNL